MTDPQPLSPQDIELVEMMLKDSGLVRSGPSIVAILRDYQRVLAENERLRHSAEILNDEVLLGIDKVATIALLQEYGKALDAGKPYPGTKGGLLLNAADMMVNLAQHLKRERAEVAALRADKERLGRFAGKLLAQLRDGCTPDGGEMQDLLTEAEVIAPVQVTEPCKAEGCVCAEYGFPMACYRNTPLGNFCQNAARSGGEGTA